MTLARESFAEAPTVVLPTAAEPSGARVPRDFGPVRWVPRVLVVLAVLWFVLVVVPGTESYAPVATDACIYAIIGLSLNIIIGYTGQLSLGHNGFFGLGAITAAYALTVQGVPFAATFALAAVVAALFALVMGLVSLRVTGLYLALITLVFGLTLEGSLFDVPEFTNGGAGQPADLPLWLIDDNGGRYYLFCLAFLVAAAFIDWQLVRSKSGRALLALKENERVAESFGIDVRAFKLLAFTLSGAMAGVAGALLAYRIGIVGSSGFGFQIALTFVLMTVVGGLGSRVGVILGSTLFAALPYLLEETPLHVVEEFVFRTDALAGAAPQFIGALGVLVTLIAYPGGIGQQIKPFTDWLSGKPFDRHASHESGPAAVEGSSARA